MDNNIYGSEINLIEQKKILLSILDYIDTFCEKHNLKYFLTYGTLLGAVRHKGFIPWDDDIDIAMNRKDYNRFIEIFAKEEDENYRVFHYSNVDGYYYQFAKVVDIRTVLIEEKLDTTIRLGAYVDIFPIDFGGDDLEDAFNINAKKMKPWILLNSIKLMDKHKKRVWYKQFIVKTLKAITKPISWKKILGKIDNLGQIYFDKVNSKYCGALIILTYGKCEIMETKWYSESIKLPFEGHMYNVPKQYDKILSNLYGDYMKLPPKEKQISNHFYKLYWAE